MNKSLLLRLEKYLKENLGEKLPEIRFFDGAMAFCEANGDYKSKTLEESIDLFLKEKGC